MTWTAEKAARAQELLSKALPGPWRWRESAPNTLETEKGTAILWLRPESEWVTRRDDTDFIAAAPTLLADALAEIERLRYWFKTLSDAIIAGGQHTIRRYCSFCRRDDFTTTEDLHSHTAECTESPAVQRAIAAEQEVERLRAVFDFMRDEHGAGSAYARSQENLRFQAEQRYEALKQRNAAEAECEQLRAECGRLEAALRTSNIDDACDLIMETWDEKLGRCMRERDAAEARAIAAEGRVKALEAILGRVLEWTHRYGKDLCPPGADTYGEGVRDSKAAVERLLMREASILSGTEGGA